MAYPNPKPFDLDGLDRDFLLIMLKRMLQAREFEEELHYLFLTHSMPGTMHQAIGQEAVAVGVVSALRPDDYITSTHRGHAHCVAKGVSLHAMMAEMFAKRTGICRGMGGSMHICDYSKGVLSAFGIVGAGIPVATGAALSSLIRGTGQVVACFFGDGAINRGVFHESLNMASLWNLPVVYVCENNQFAFSMTARESTTMERLADRACAYNIPGEQVDGNNVVAVYRAAQNAISRARQGEGPTLMECVTYRIRGHARFEAAGYRDASEVEIWKQQDPILAMRTALLKSGLVNESDLEEIQAEVESEIREAIAFAEMSEDVQADDFWPYITDEGDNA
jgi:TPP-dependent pyruvate/acetoin dehydrogenase alpha subunit